MIRILALSFGGGFLHAFVGYFLIIYHVVGGMDEGAADRAFETWFQPGVGFAGFIGWDLETRALWPVFVTNFLVYSALTGFVMWIWLRTKAKPAITSS